MNRDRVERAAQLIDRLLSDPGFRAGFRERPGEAARAYGLGDVAGELERVERPHQTLDGRESRSSLAGAFLAAAAEGVQLVELMRHAHADLGSDGARAVARAATRRAIPLAPRAHAVAPGGADPPHARAAGSPPRGHAAATAPVRAPARARSPAGHGAVADAASAAVPSGGMPPYPGDGASKAAIAGWMAACATRSGLPPELPVIAALQESSLHNDNSGDRDSLGYFQMRQGEWDHGAFRGYLQHPRLQMKWFIQRALEERRNHPGVYSSSAEYGLWAADIERPAEQNRGLYQPHLAEARRLIAEGRTAYRLSSPRAARAPAPPPPDRPVIRNTAVVQAARPEQPGGPPRVRMVDFARREIGQAETNTNDSPRIRVYRSATDGAPGPGPWCAYFVSWLAHKAGVPLGDHGQGFAGVDALWAWAQSAGRAVVNGPDAHPRPGDLIVFHEHIGIVEKALPDGRIQTIEGNYSDHVARVVHAPGDAVGFVRMP